MSEGINGRLDDQIDFTYTGINVNFFFKMISRNSKLGKLFSVAVIFTQAFNHNDLIRI